jgi:hypothetical protein
LPDALSSTSVPPGRFSDLSAAAPDRTRSCRAAPQWLLKRHVTDPRYLASTASRALPPPAFALPRSGGEKACNSYMPRGTNQDRLLWSLQVRHAPTLASSAPGPAGAAKRLRPSLAPTSPPTPKP